MNNTVRIFIGAGMSFEVPRGAYDEALTMATLSRKVWFVGLTKEGVEVGPSRADLFAKGCDQIAWVTPLNRTTLSPMPDVRP